MKATILPDLPKPTRTLNSIVRPEFVNPLFYIKPKKHHDYKLVSLGFRIQLGPKNKTPRRKFHGESDVQIKKGQFQGPEVKN